MKKIIIIIIASLLFLTYLYNNFFTTRMLIGTYVNMNYKNSIEDPNIPDTLILLQNNTFSSQYFGTGKYSLSYSISGSKLNLIFDDVIHQINIHPNIKRINFNHTKIILCSDLNHYYEKIN